jgi:hypothetical protein
MLVARRPTMSQSTRRWVSEKVKSLRESDVLPFHEILDAKMVEAAVAEENVTFCERIYTPLETLCVFLSQGEKRGKNGDIGEWH